MPVVSVIIASHNRSAFLPRAVASAQAASKTVEVLVVDDASTDETADVCQSISGIRYFRLKRNRPLLLDMYQRLVGGELPESPASSKNCGIHPWAREEVGWI
jgi:glycosyltransferase involved in cell wall biosynthesis